MSDYRGQELLRIKFPHAPQAWRTNFDKGGFNQLKRGAQISIRVASTSIFFKLF